MYEPAPVHQMIDNLSHIYGLYRDVGFSAAESLEAQRERMVVLRSILDNLKHENSQLSPRTLGALSQHARLTIGGSFRLVGYPLDKMREVEYLLHGHRTRIIESYPFYRDREIDLPHELTQEDLFSRNAFVSDIVMRWQRRVPIRALCGPAWQREGIFYVQVGAEDNPTLSGLPPGAVLSIEPVSTNEQLHPDPKAIYCLQFADGYRCCGCAASTGKLSLLPYSHSYFGKYQFFYPQEVRIVGRARGFAVRLPSLANETLEASRYRGGAAPLVLPWEQPSLSALLRTERLRFGLTKQALERANEILHALTGTTLSLRTLRRYEHGTQTTPRTDVLVALALVHSVCFSDVLRLLGLWQDESDRYSLKTWLSVTTLDELQIKNLRSAITPEPHHRWQIFLKGWGEWPTLLSMAIPGMEQFQHLLLRIHQEDNFSGLIPLIHPGAIALIEEVNGIPEMRADREKSEWDRPLYVIRHKQNILCGYLDYDGEYITLIPHPRTSARRLSFLRHQVEIIGKWIGVASPLPHER